MSWIADNLVLLAALALVLLVVAGFVLLAVRGMQLWRTTQAAQARVAPQVADITSGLAQAEQRAGEITEHQEHLAEAIDRASRQAQELGVILAAAAKALAVLRAPLKYMGR